MVVALWKQKRLITAETAEISIQQLCSGALPPPTDIKLKRQAILRMERASGFPATSENYVRYDSMLERQYYTAMNMLHRVQSMRKQANKEGLVKREITFRLSRPNGPKK